MTNSKTDKDIEAGLFSANRETVLSALNFVKERGNIAYLPLLFELLRSGKEEAVDEKIIDILSNLKVRESAGILAEALHNPQYKSIRKTLTAACWQNGLDYSQYLTHFIDLVIHEDWETGFEAFTVIENMEHLPTEEISAQTRDQIYEALQDADEKKKYFLREILVMIR